MLKRLRPEYAEDAKALTAASQVVAINFQTIAAANNYWRKSFACETCLSAAG